MVFAPRRPKGQEDSAQGFNPGNPPPKRCALKGRQLGRNKTHAENELAHVDFRLNGRQATG
jgi:hypothetical protein